MNIAIHRGANQIGGCITEISTEECKILIDFGCNLPGTKAEELTEELVKEITAGADAVFYTHFHGDHIGLHHLIPSEIKQYLGAGAKEVMLCKYEVLKRHKDCNKNIDCTKRMLTYEANKPIDVNEKGKIIVTPYFVSHSAFDAYMFKIECEGKTILHTGDFRRHGYLGKGLFPTLRKYIGQVDVLITEGTMLGRKQEKVISEKQVQLNIINALRQHKYVFALCSSTDLDRLATFHNACKETNRVFFVDEYQSNVLKVFSKYAGSKSASFNFDQVFQLINYKTENVQKKLRHQGFLMPVRLSQYSRIRNISEVYNDEEPWLLYSMWDGYAVPDKDYTIEEALHIREFFGSRILDGTKDGVHTSGHADPKTLSQLCTTVNPRIGVIPIHKEASSTYESSVCPVLSDGSYSINGINFVVK